MDGCASIDLENINVIYLFWNEKETRYNVSFFVSWDNWSEVSDFVIALNRKEYTLLMDIIKKIFEIVKTEIEVISWRDTAYYVKKKSD